MLFPGDVASFFSEAVLSGTVLAQDSESSGRAEARVV